jgi:hypothetical protein
MLLNDVIGSPLRYHAVLGALSVTRLPHRLLQACINSLGLALIPESYAVRFPRSDSTHSRSEQGEEEYKTDASSPAVPVILLLNA